MDTQYMDSHHMGNLHMDIRHMDSHRMGNRHMDIDKDTTTLSL